MPRQFRHNLSSSSSKPYPPAELEALLKESELPGPPTPLPTKSSHEESVLDKNLRLALSLHSTSPSSSSAEEENHTPADDAPYLKIGAGACGAIFAQAGGSAIVKLAKDPNNPELWNDFRQHVKITKSFEALFSDDPPIQIPKPLGYVPPTKTSFFSATPALVQAAEPIISSLPTRALVAERILPLPRSTRHLLIEKYCAPRGKQKALADPANSDCLVRVYLGSTNGKSGGMFFSLRNLKLHLNQLTELDLDIEELASRMGIALAAMHWGARTDARDVEFVLGASSTEQVPQELQDDLDNIEADAAEPQYVGPATYHGLDDFFCRQTEMWVLDFNQVRDITLDDAGVALAVEAVKLNDPYFPKPLKESEAEEKAWKAFVFSYRKNSQTILEQALKENKGLGDMYEILALPRKFVLGIVELERERMARREGANA
ncbi:zinc finger protein-domain-containing protein [Neurospora tetraspora]|uniref:Zinc finger protein-domain-containing protein n=1 Tax=Neurospora tetraspora TaxID=94610 RepID=A0AAE0JR66_9PEZI|nr:zinc finger protein-domain-containing protein [Neurospora tetraspora]